MKVRKSAEAANPQRLLQGKRATHSTRGMVFVTDGRSEKRHKSVAAKLVESASVFKHNVAHVCQITVQDVHGVLRVKPLGQRSEPPQIAKQNGDLALFPA